MIIVTRADATPADIDRIRERVEALGLRTHLSRGTVRTIIGCVGDEDALRETALAALPGVESVTPILKPYKLAAREFVPEDTIVRVGAARIGGADLAVIAGPCAVEDRDGMLALAADVRRGGATLLRGGAFKPRTSPYAFQGLGAAALEILAEARAASGLPVVTEVLDTRHVELVAGHVDMLQVGARNMQNFALLAELGRLQRPVLLKRGLSATLRELLMAAEHIMAQGNHQVVLCERGIRTFETATRNTLDVAAIPVLKRETHLPILVDPSHAAGRAELVPALAFAAVAAGADGLLIEVHASPAEALSDGEQSLRPAEFQALMERLRAFAAAAGRGIAEPAAPVPGGLAAVSRQAVA
jgi:3-deoxy-7-phosphoheptulonate synthase